ncbi:hypothetical protein OV208_22650 [Corallococcus sp. bb12-1]|uniref:hypothetical protein n=1 Tax=Corallococcus sp. bb12-1 TaxID=2996784 RepID=UPI00226DACCC|nr:hypothetical protein [Corallococcus sp. bb12-1]MCY1044135.1 hypothetical protein [Corallococcus sp. bb12-1]
MKLPRSRLRTRLAGAMLALALVGALSAGMASGVDRARRKKLPRASEPPPQAEEVPQRSSRTPHLSARPASLLARADGARDALSGEGQGSAPRAGKPHDLASSPSTVSVALTPDSGDDASSADSAASPPTVLHTSARIPAPLHVSWRVVESREDSVRLVARLERSPGFTAPVRVSLRVPSRVLLQDGPMSPAVLEADVEEVSWTLHLPAGTRPEEDLVLLASAEGESFGVHAEARYSFGRTLAEAALPVPQGPPLPDSLMRARE